MGEESVSDWERIITTLKIPPQLTTSKSAKNHASSMKNTIGVEETHPNTNTTDQQGMQPTISTGEPCGDVTPMTTTDQQGKQPARFDLI